MNYVIVASSRSRSTEIYLDEDGNLLEVQHLKSGRDIVTAITEIPPYLTVRYPVPIPAQPIRLYAES